jgi:hypothetical protein
MVRLRRMGIVDDSKKDMRSNWMDGLNRRWITRIYIHLAFLYTGNVLVLYSTSLATVVKIRSKMNILHSPHQGPSWSAIHIGKTRGKTRKNPQTRLAGAGLVRV